MADVCPLETGEYYRKPDRSTERTYEDFSQPFELEDIC